MDVTDDLLIMVTCLWHVMWRVSKSLTFYYHQRAVDDTAVNQPIRAVAIKVRNLFELLKNINRGIFRPWQGSLIFVIILSLCVYKHCQTFLLKDHFMQWSKNCLKISNFSNEMSLGGDPLAASHAWNYCGPQFMHAVRDAACTWHTGSDCCIDSFREISSRQQVALKIYSYN